MAILLNLAVLSAIIFLVLKLAKSFLGSSGQNGKEMPRVRVMTTVRGFMAEQRHLHILFKKWTQTYGHTFTCDLGVKKLVILNDAKTIKEAFTNPLVLGRPELAPINPFRLPKNGIARNENESWVLQRKISLRHLKNFGFGAGWIMEKLIVEEILELVDELDASKGGDVNMKKKFFFPTMNAIWIVMASLRLGEEDKAKKQLFLYFCHGMESVIKNGFIVLIPSFVDYFPWIPTWSSYQKTAIDIRAFIGELIQRHKNQMSEAVGEPTDFIFAYLKDNCLFESESNQFDKEAESQLESILMDFVFGGFETTSTMMEWVIQHVVNHPDVQAKLHEELDRVIGKSGRLPTIDDRPNLPYTEAVLMESLRLTPSVPIGLMHETTGDTKIGGYEVKTNTTVISNLYAAQRDPSEVKDSDLFLPERFLNPDKTGVVTPPFLMPFSVGKRFCLGEFVARDTMFILITAIFMKFQLRPTTTPAKNKPSGGGSIFSPGDFFATFHRRS